ncbi:substrate-binding periplasmic protein [Marinomonas posidonica]|uniref:ABC-type transporter, periplasmic subunit family 3 n=1 Tax=Marinomonas posidonica (strain CECT 7376 / NCIMB 14433 / IVIA-Po-181) TaxID=491952 RepID=F6CY63_MARPP|nr:transporter substrate-binding domain-containing protein [Marinomonas posidonica]AEF55695.1 ABC-type transporter, periplasmic subunit family 3 [Marinomonas posidonica IVIA-Po-181]
MSRAVSYYLFSLVLIVFSQVSVAAGPSLASCDELTATGNSEYPPFLWRDKQNSMQLQGANRIIMDELSHRIGVPIRLQHVGPWSRAQSEVKAGRIDLMAGAFYTNNRADYMDYFTPVILYTQSVVWQRKATPFPFQRKEDLQGHWGVTVINNSFGEQFDRYAKDNLNILTVASLAQALKMLATNRVDYVLYEKSPAQAYAGLLGLSDELEAVEPHVSSEGLYLTFSKASACNTPGLRHRIAIALRDMNQEGFMEQALLDGVSTWSLKNHQALLN